MRLHLLVGFIVLLAAKPAFGQATMKRCSVAIDIGHTQYTPGSISARGIEEYTLNRAMANLLLNKLQQDGRVAPMIIDGNGMTLQQRTQFAAAHHATIFLSLHHDSVQPRYLSTWIYEGTVHQYSDKFHGFSLFISQQNPHSKQSRDFAETLGTQLLAAGFTPTLHHAENIPGENRTLLDRKRGIYAFDDLIVLKTATMPAALLECGVIVNREEELHLSDSKRRARMIDAIAIAIERSCPRILSVGSTPRRAVNIR